MGRWGIQSVLQTQTGVDVLLGQLIRRYGQFDVETSIFSIIELLTYRRNHHELIDDALARFEAIRSRVEAEHVPNFAMPPAASVWLLLEALSIHRDSWPLKFQSTGGQRAQFERDDEPNSSTRTYC